VTGELYLGGVGLGRGYLNRPELTAERFVPHPSGRGERLYRTGDLARYRADGAIEYLGRTDHQVKIRGQRIELGEIESQLLEHPAVREAAVLARQDRPGEAQLVAYVVAAPTASDAELSTEALQRWLGERLPEYMVPRAHVRLESMPLSANGKLDRKALPAPDWSGGRARYEAPRSEVERRLVALWEELLGVERVGVNDDLFALGGHSLLITRLASRIRSDFAIEIPLRALFEAPSVAAVARLVESRTSASSSASSSEGGAALVEELLRDL
jgi:acyl carrier protein